MGLDDIGFDEIRGFGPKTVETLEERGFENMADTRLRDGVGRNNYRGVGQSS